MIGTVLALCVKFKFSRVKVCVVAMYSPTEGKVEERERFWDDFDGILDRVAIGYRLCVLGELN